MVRIHAAWNNCWGGIRPNWFRPWIARNCIIIGAGGRKRGGWGTRSRRIAGIKARSLRNRKVGLQRFGSPARSRDALRASDIPKRNINKLSSMAERVPVKITRVIPRAKSAIHIDPFVARARVNLKAVDRISVFNWVQKVSPRTGGGGIIAHSGSRERTECWGGGDVLTGKCKRVREGGKQGFARSEGSINLRCLLKEGLR